MWLVLTLITTLFWGFGQVFSKKGLSYTTPLFNNIVGALATIIITIPAAFLLGANIQDVLRILPLSLLIATLLLSYYYVIAKGNISLTGTVLGSSPLLVVFLSFLFLNEHPSVFQMLAALLVMTGTLTLILAEDLELSKKLRFGSWVVWGLAGAGAAGSADFLSKVVLDSSHIKGSTYVLAYGISFVIVVCISFFIDKNGRQFPKFNRKILPTLIGDTMLEVGMIFFFLALSSGFASIVAPISSFYVGITAVLAWIFLHEKANKLQMAAVAISCAGIILLGVQ